MNNLWERCVSALRDEVPLQQFNTWIRPLHAIESPEALKLLAPNRFVLDWVREHFGTRIQALVSEWGGPLCQVQLEIGSRAVSRPAVVAAPLRVATVGAEAPVAPVASLAPQVAAEGVSVGVVEGPGSGLQFGGKGDLSVGNINPLFNFHTFVEGKSNQLAKAAAVQVASNPGKAYNPLFLYGGVGLGKTHLMHAIGNVIRERNPQARVLYLHSERFVSDMIKALQRNVMNEFKRFYRSIDALLIDDIQFFAGKDRSQEEFFHTFNALLDNHHQIVLSCDRYPKEIHGLEERLQSRFGWGLTVAIEPPELETRVAILVSKAEQVNVQLSQDVAFFIAKNIQSNVRELEGALKRVIANAHFTGQLITIDFVRDALKDLLTLQAKLVTIENIQKMVAEYYKIKISDLLSKRRNRSLARPRQLAMALAKELTSHSLPEIGEAFNGRDHTTVLHACRKMKELLAESLDVQEDWKNLLRILST